MDPTRESVPVDPLSGWLRTGGLLQSSFVRDMLQRDSLAIAPGERIGAWRVIEEIGRGGMGVVFRAERADGAYRKEIALKLIDGKIVRDEQRAMFVRERQLLAELDHPGIVRLLDGGEWTGGQPWFALELVRGMPIDRHIVEHRLALPARIDLLLAVAAAVAYAHRRLVIHRDLKPANVLVDEDGRVRLLDFGISGIALGDDGGVSGLGTPAFASPQQRAGAAPTTGDDVYALGRLLQQLAGDAMPADLASIAARATEPDAERRYASVASFVDDLERFRAGLPVAAHRGGLRYRLTRHVARHPVAAVAALVAIGVVAAFVVALLQQRGEARMQAQRAQTINRFLIDDLLTNANPMLSGDAYLSVHAALDRAAATVDARFANDPLVREEVEFALARSYRGLGLYDAAETHAQRAVALNAARVGERGPESWAVRGLLADLAGERQPVDDADPQFAQLLDEMARVGAGDSPVAIEIAFDRARMHARASRTETVIAALDALLPRARRVLGRDHVDVISMESLLGNSYAFANRLDDAETLLRGVLARSAPDDPAVELARLGVKQDLAFTQRQRGKADEALQLQGEVVAKFTTLLGRTHPDTHSALNEHAGMLQDAGRTDDAAALFREVLESRLAREGEAHYKTRTSMNNLGMLLSSSGKLDEAAVWLRRVHELELRLSGADARETLQAAHNLAGLERKLGNYARAIALHADVVARARSAFGDGRPEPSMMRYGHAVTLIAAERFDEATTELRAATAELERTLGPDHARVKTARERLAELERDPVAARARVVPPPR